MPPKFLTYTNERPDIPKSRTFLRALQSKNIFGNGIEDIRKTAHDQNLISTIKKNDFTHIMIFSETFQTILFGQTRLFHTREIYSQCILVYWDKPVSPFLIYFDYFRPLTLIFLSPSLETVYQFISHGFSAFRINPFSSSLCYHPVKVKTKIKAVGLHQDISILHAPFSRRKLWSFYMHDAANHALNGSIKHLFRDLSIDILYLDRLPNPDIRNFVSLESSAILKFLYDFHHLKRLEIILTCPDLQDRVKILGTHDSPVLANIPCEPIRSASSIESFYASVFCMLCIPQISVGIHPVTLDILLTQNPCFHFLTRDLVFYFKPGRDIVAFTGRKDFLDKLQYYTNHEDELKKIVRAGHKKAATDFSAKNFVRSVLKIIGEK